MQRLQGYFWRVRSTLSARWWMLRFDLRAAWRLVRYAILAARGRVIILDEQGVESRGGYHYVQLAISQLPTAGKSEDGHRK